MDVQSIINLLLPYWGIIAVVFGFGGYALFQHDSAKKIILSLIIRIEKEAESLALNTGADKFQFLVERGYQLLPTPARLFITLPMFESLAQSLYNTAKLYLVVEKAPVTPITETPATIPQPIISDPAQPILSDVPVIPVVPEAPVTPIITEIPVTPIPPVITIIEPAPITPISTIPFVPQTVIDALTEQITLIAQQTANTTITNITNKAIADAMAKATNTPVI